MDDDLYVIQIKGLAGGAASAFDGQFLKEYDPSIDGRDPIGRPMLAHIECTPDMSDAKTYATVTDAHAEWTRIDPRQPTRPDGRPNRPLTAFTVEFARKSVFAKGVT